jgi:hypothetical protein
MAETRKRSKRATKAPAAAEAVCPVALCPIGMFLSVGGDVRPEAVEHLLSAGRELMLAFKAVIDARVQDVGEPATLHRIEVE